MNTNINANENTLKNSGNFIGYEYKEITVDREKEGVYTDGYASFGWKPDGAEPVFGLSAVNLRFKRDRKILNKAELTRLQRQFESGVKEIEKLEQSKSQTAFIAALATGLTGTALMAGSTFAFLAGLTPLCIVLAVPAFIGWALPYLCYVKIKNKRIKTVAPLIERQYDAIYEACEKAHSLLA